MKAWYQIDSLGWILLQQQNLEAAQKHVDIGDEIAKRYGFIDAVAQAACHRSQISAYRGEWELSREILQPFLDESVPITPIVRRHVLTFWAEQRLAEGRQKEAEEVLIVARGLCKEIDDLAGLSYVLLVLANLRMSLGDNEYAFETFNQILEFESQLDRSGVIARAQLGLAKLALIRHDYKHAHNLAMKAAERFERVGIELEATETRKVMKACSNQA